MPNASRRELEASVVASASSIDGRRFTFQCSVHGLELLPGSYVSIGEGLGQIHAVERALAGGGELASVVSEEVSASPAARIALARGHGVVLDDGVAPFHEVPILRRATCSEM